MVDWIKRPTMPWPGRIAANTEEPIVSIVRGAEPPTGPSMPHPMEKAPHQDIGELVSDFIGDLQGAGELASSFLDQPFHQTLNIDGPHRIVDNVLDVQSGVVRGLIKKVYERGK
jgi:hypothetical protein